MKISINNKATETSATTVNQLAAELHQVRGYNLSRYRHPLVYLLWPQRYAFFPYLMKRNRFFCQKKLA